MAGARVISIIGRKDAGKTTLTVALAAELVRRGQRVMTLKHGSHAPALDTHGTDSWRHFNEGRAERTLLSGEQGLVLFDRAPDAYDPLALVQRFLADADIVLVEGYKRAALPRIEVWRKGIAPGPIYHPELPDAHRWVALVTDDRSVRSDEVRVLQFGDTMWIQLLATLAWERAIEVGA
jgi:molybdopterin-guanine dinucleotide biosynthesis protein MobB